MRHRIGKPSTPSSHISFCVRERDDLQRVIRDQALIHRASESEFVSRRLCTGGQGAVYEAVQQSTKRKVAGEVLLESRDASKPARRRFEREIELVAQLKHPNINSIFHSGVTNDGRPFYVMDYVRGVPLHPPLQSPRSAQRAVEHPHGLLVANDLFLLRNPANRAPQADGDVAQVADRVGANRRFERIDRRLPGLDAVDEVAVLPRTTVETNLVRTELDLEQRGIAGTQARAINAHPALAAEERRTVIAPALAIAHHDRLGTPVA
ncbi:MAG: protein kinase [Planctomycetes bacterium]|nr:protein kinase [Planctomycetota bacterium]